jgi:hypothetical protein
MDNGVDIVCVGRGSRSVVPYLTSTVAVLGQMKFEGQCVLWRVWVRDFH